MPCAQTALTICVEEGSKARLCPITDVKLVSKADYVAEQYAGYQVADSPNSIDWLLIYSRSSDNLPLARFELTEEAPCPISKYFQVKTATVDENIEGRTRDPFYAACKYGPDLLIEGTYRSASETVTITESVWLEYIGVFD